jgi:predicted O-methyltransferase YrrM
MSDRKPLNVFIGVPAYGGNGGIASEVPDIRKWMLRTVKAMYADDRIDQIHELTINDTPITMVRNDFVQHARESKCDLLVMVDSDQSPDLYLGKDAEALPFWESSFDFLWKHYEKGPVCIGAPYCGPPPHPTKGGMENVYVFHWSANESPTWGGHNDSMPVMQQYTRAHANMMKGIGEVAALPTGLILYDMRCFDLMTPPYFDYEYTDQYRRRKASTEDVYNTRNIALAGYAQLKYNPVFCNWDAWAGHWKPKCVGRPYTFSVDAVSDGLKDAIDQNVTFKERLANVDYDNPDPNAEKVEPQWAPRHGDAMGVEVPQQDWKMQERLLNVAVARKGDGPLLLAEVGTFVGNNAVRISDLLDSLNCPHVIYCVDTFKGTASDVTGKVAKEQGGSFLDKFKENTAHKGDKIVPIVGDSIFGAAQVPNELDYIFIDADHCFEAVTSDVAAWWPKLRDGGLMVGHDFQWPEVDAAWKDAIVCRLGIPLDSNGENVCWVRKPPVEELVGATDG